MSDELYLIAHKVRGQPAFDIAIRLTIGDEEGWMIPTSGHRAYPLWWAELNRTMVPSGVWNGANEVMIDVKDMEKRFAPSAFDHLEDHYPSRPANEPSPTALGILARLGLGRRPPTITRRV